MAIVRALVPIDGRLVETEPKTKRGRRLIALDGETVTVLRRQAASQLAEQQMLVYSGPHVLDVHVYQSTGPAADYLRDRPLGLAVQMPDVERQS